MKRGCIFLISARKNLLKECLESLDKNYNSRYNYPILIFYHGDRYDDEQYRNTIREINPDTEYRFHSIEGKIPEHLEDKDLFWNYPNNYARSFGRQRVGYLHANYFWNNFMNYKELDEFDYLHRIDDDSWFKEEIPFNFFDELDKNDCYFGTGLTWNHFHPNHLDTRANLFDWIKYYVDKYNVDVKNEQLRQSLDGKVDNEMFHTLRWNCGNCNIYNRKMFETQEWRQYLQEFNDLAGGYRYRWGDIEVIGLFAYIHLDNPILDFELKEKGIYQGKIPHAQMVFS